MTDEQRAELDAYIAANPQTPRQKSFIERAMDGELTAEESAAHSARKAKSRRLYQFGSTPRSLDGSWGR
jgi:hypothetical protein